MDPSSLVQDVAISLGVVVVLIFSLRLIDRMMERQVGVTKFTRQLTLIVLTAMADVVVKSTCSRRRFAEREAELEAIEEGEEPEGELS